MTTYFICVLLHEIPVFPAGRALRAGPSLFRSPPFPTRPARSSTVAVIVGAVGPGAMGLSCCLSAVTPLNVGVLSADWLPAGPPWSLSFPSVTEGMGLGDAAFLPALVLGWSLHAGCSLAPGASWAPWGVLPAPGRLGSWEQLLQVQAFLGLSLPTVSLLPPLCLVTECFRHYPDTEGPSASRSGMLGSPSGLGSHLSFLSPPAPGQWG